ncbi:DsbA family protein [Myroides injenensis]|uniref:DsbA family protein n=1 Tax=Myroides injenensis TaxID=1183151 RepID=UPI001ED94D1D|nr:DsbA family protein [Myroides injenensis]
MKILYLMDPLCGWCYGNHDNMDRLYHDFNDKIIFDIIPAGMWVGDNKRIQSEQMANFFVKHDTKIAEYTNTEFGQAYFNFVKNNHNIVLDSEIPSKAIITIKNIDANKTMAFTSEIQKARYLYGLDLNNNATYTIICELLNIDVNTFLHHFESKTIEELTLKSFKEAAKYASSYPTLLLQTDNQLIELEQGYETYDNLKSKIALYL